FEIGRDLESSPDRRILEPLGVSDAIQRQAETDTEGRFTFDPLPAGVYVVQPVEQADVPGQVLVRRPLRGIFAPQKVTIRKGGTLQAGQVGMFGESKLDHDIKALEIIRYDETVAMVKATAKDGRPIKDLILAGEYTEEIPRAGATIGLKNGVQTEILFERQG